MRSKIKTAALWVDGHWRPIVVASLVVLFAFMLAKSIQHEQYLEKQLDLARQDLKDSQQEIRDLRASLELQAEEAQTTRDLLLSRLDASNQLLIKSGLSPPTSTEQARRETEPRRGPAGPKGDQGSPGRDASPPPKGPPPDQSPSTPPTTICTTIPVVGTCSPV